MELVLVDRSSDELTRTHIGVQAEEYATRRVYLRRDARRHISRSSAPEMRYVSNRTHFMALRLRDMISLDFCMTISRCRFCSESSRRCSSTYVHSRFIAQSRYERFPFIRQGRHQQRQAP